MATGDTWAAADAPTPAKALFVLEQTLGNAVYGALVERAAAAHDRIDPEVFRVEDTPGPLGRLPVLGNWTLRAGWTARRGVLAANRRRQPDVLFVCTSVSAMLMGDVMRRVPTILSTDATPLNYDSVGAAYGHDVGKPWVEDIKRGVVARVFGRAEVVVAWSTWTADSLIRDYGVDPARIRRIPPGVDLSVFACDPRPRREDPMRVLFVGGDFERKGGWDLVNAIVQLDGVAELDVVTNAPMTGLPPAIRVHRGLTHESGALRELFQSADVFALPTHGDCAPHAVVEALAAGLPVVSTRVGAVPEMLGFGERGVLIAPRDVRALRDALAWFASNPEARLAMGAKASAYAHEVHDSSANMRQLMDLVVDVSTRPQTSAAGATTRGAVSRTTPATVELL